MQIIKSFEPTLFDEPVEIENDTNDSDTNDSGNSNRDSSYSTPTDEEHARWKELTVLLHKYQKAYEADQPLVSDQEYDRLYLELRILEEKFGVLPESPSINIGFINIDSINPEFATKEEKKAVKKLDDRGYISHMSPMLSLDHQIIEVCEYDQIKEGFEFFLDKINRFLGMRYVENGEDVERRFGIEYEFIGQPKIDGVSLSLHYENGELKTAALRGNGVEGEDVTDNILTMKTVPRKISYKEPIDIRGELFMSIEQFEKLSENGVVFASPRHAASGTARLLDSELFAQRGLQLFIHGFASDNKELFKQKYTDIYNQLKKDGFPMMPMIVASKAEEAIKYFANLCDTRAELDYLLDGVVFKLNDLSLYETLAHSSKAPRYAFALKFPAEQAVAQIVDIKWQVGRTGVLTPVVEIKETNIGGVNIRFVTMHNASEFLRHSPKQGDWAKIERAGDVIPAIISVEHALNNESVLSNESTLLDVSLDMPSGPVPLDKHSSLNKPEISNISISLNEHQSLNESVTFNKYAPLSALLPENCPSCNTKTIFDDKFLYCKNGWKCKDQIIARLMHFVSRDAMDIDGLGEQRLEFLYNKNLLLYPDDIFTLFDRADQQQLFLEEMNGWGKKSVNKLHKQIEESRNIEFSRFLYSLGIDGVGKNIAQKIANMCENWEEFLNWIPVAESVDGVGRIMQEKIQLFISEEKDWIDRLLEQVKIYRNVGEMSNSNGLSVVFTGTFSLSRQAMKEIAVKNGFQVKDSISVKLDYLIYGEDAGSKLRKAQELNIKTLNQDEWNALLNNLYTK